LQIGRQAGAIVHNQSDAWFRLFQQVVHFAGEAGGRSGREGAVFGAVPPTATPSGMKTHGNGLMIEYIYMCSCSYATRFIIMIAFQWTLPAD
jgi:hypothetical protein